MYVWLMKETVSINKVYTACIVFTCLWNKQLIYIHQYYGNTAVSVIDTAVIEMVSATPM